MPEESTPTTETTENTPVTETSESTPVTATPESAGSPETAAATERSGTAEGAGGAGGGAVRAGSVARAFGLGCLGCGGVALAAVLALVLVLMWNASDGTDLPRVAPEDMADRAFRHSQEAYDVMGFTRTVQPGVEDAGVSPQNTLGAEYCYDGGTFGLEDKTVDGAYRLYHEWALDRVPASRAVPGLRRLHQHLRDEGWEVSSYREGGRHKDWMLYVKREGEGRLSFIWDPERQYFTGGSATRCAYDPGWKGGGTEAYEPDSAADAVDVPALGPGRL
ncbi:hypothetical protein JK359_06705 [Streptomyces actinomycinicus]|uniref:Uncharacterized protein n=1 Tax=Streptomyces actinomycinicus TaxID=1695166 RepID=A0A937JKS4_9ACTN|nr:hypothetical protein [Streptomyces actinomycinicus]MBL1081670.1 hypothetical protein [Streptomyces actinomycinicus]